MTTTRPLALVTGASSGIGLELAKQFAAHDFDLVIAAEDAQLSTVAVGIAASGVTVEAVEADLRTDAGVDELWRRVASIGRPLAAAALNAGVVFDQIRVRPNRRREPTERSSSACERSRSSSNSSLKAISSQSLVSGSDEVIHS